MKKENTAMFIGHSQCYNLNRAMLKEKIIFLIENGIDTFLSGGMGEFDRVSAHEVHRLMTKIFMTRSFFPKENYY